MKCQGSVKWFLVWSAQLAVSPMDPSYLGSPARIAVTAFFYNLSRKLWRLYSIVEKVEFGKMTNNRMDACPPTNDLSCPNEKSSEDEDGEHFENTERWGPRNKNTAHEREGIIISRVNPATNHISRTSCGKGQGPGAKELSQIDWARVGRIWSLKLAKAKIHRSAPCDPISPPPYPASEITDPNTRAGHIWRCHVNGILKEIIIHYLI